MKGNFENSGKLARFMLKRELVVSAVWILILTAFSAGLAPGLAEMFPDPGERAQFAATLDNPVMVAMMGPVYGMDNYTVGAMYSTMILLWIMIAVGIMNIFLVVRHTRADEEKGRAEVVRSLPVGRMANLNGAMITVFVVNAVLGLLVGLGIGITGTESMYFAPSMLYGAVLFATGLVFAAIAALFCQLSSSKSGAMGYSFLAMGAAYMLRAAGDMGNEILSLISPLGFPLRAQVFVGNYLWPVIVMILIALFITAVAYKLNSMRDLDQGFIPARPGRREGSMRGPQGLAFRLLGNGLISWLIIMFLFGAAYGSIIGDISDFVGNSPQYLEMIGLPPEVIEFLSPAEREGIIQNYFMAFTGTMMILIAVVPLINAAMKPRSEERDHRAEHALSRSVSRAKYMGSYAILAYGASILLPIAVAIGTYSVAAGVLGDANPFAFGDMVAAYIVYIPALWVMIGAAILLVGLLPKYTAIIWGFYGFVCLVSLLGAMLNFPAWLSRISPLAHVPQTLLAGEINFTPLIGLTIIAAVLTAAGFLFYGRRDVLI